MAYTRQWNLYLRAMAVTALACLVCWALAQQANKIPVDAPLKSQVQHLKKFYEAEDYEAILSLAESISTPFNTDSLRADCFLVLRYKTIALTELEQAPQAVLQLTSIVQAQTIDDSITAKLYYLLSYACLNARQIEQGIEYAELSLAGLQRHRASGIANAYKFIAFALKAQGDFRAARQYYLSALPLLAKQQDPWNLSEVLINLGDLSRYISEYDAARNYYRQADKEYPDAHRLAHNLGWVDSNAGLYQSALLHFREACLDRSYAEELARIMGQCADRLGDTLSANRYFKVALKTAATARDSAIAQYYIGKALLGRHQVDAALGTFQQALHGLFPQTPADNPSENPNTGLSSDFWPNLVLRGKAQALHALYAQTGNLENLKQGMAAINTAIRALDSLRGNMRNELSGQDAVDYSYATYETGIQIARSLELAEPGKGYLADAYDMAERAKANVLKTSLAERDLRRVSLISDSLLQQEKMAQASVVFWEGAGPADSLLLAVRRLEKVRAAIDREAPLLRKARAQYESVALATIQQGLGKDELLLQYFWGDSAVIAFAVSKNSLNIHSISRTLALDQSIEAFRTALTQYQQPIETFNVQATTLYSLFCEPILKNAQGMRRLLIVPDGPLGSIPFETLVGNKGQYLLEDYAISYHWSGALWLQAHARGEAAELATRYGGFAPQYKTVSEGFAALGPELVDLPEARAAVAATAKAWGGDVFQGTAVDKQLFQREAGKYGVLHLAMHGILNEQGRTKTGLAFLSGDSITLLNTLEISQMELPARLAVLSACNTASGVVFRGEGVMSLSRAFALAGCPAMTANLWEVPSAETNNITTAFLGFLKDGKRKDEALRAAKRDFLARSESERRHPYFWAGQVLMGNERPVRQARNWLWYLLGALVLGGLGWYYGRKWLS